MKLIEGEYYQHRWFAIHGGLDINLPILKIESLTLLDKALCSFYLHKKGKTYKKLNSCNGLTFGKPKKENILYENGEYFVDRKELKLNYIRIYQIIL